MRILYPELSCLASGDKNLLNENSKKLLPEIQRLWRRKRNECVGIDSGRIFLNNRRLVFFYSLDCLNGCWLGCGNSWGRCCGSCRDKIIGYPACRQSSATGNTPQFI